MDYRPFIGLLASIFVMAGVPCSNAAVFTQTERPLNSNSAGPKKLSADETNQLLSGSTKIDDLITLCQQESRLCATLRPQDLNRDFLLLISIARGIAQRPLVGGHAWQFGNDWICQF